MKKIFPLIIMLTLFQRPGFSQITFQINYNYGLFDWSAGVKRITNGYVSAGWATSFLFPVGVLMQTDTMGTIQWARSYSGGLFQPLTFNDFQKTSAGGYIMTGQIARAALVKVNATGTVVNFSAQYGISNEWGNGVKEAIAGDYIVAGATKAKSMNPVKDSTSIYIFKTNSTGTYQWGRSYTLTSPVFDSHDAANDVVEVSNGYVFTGYISDNNGIDTTRNILLFKTDFNGTLLWMESIGAVANNEEGYSVKVLPSGNLLVAGYTDKTATFPDAGDVVFIETDPNGNIVFSAAYSVGLGDYAGSIQQTSNGGYSVIGWTFTNLFPLTIKSFLLTLNSAHTPLIAKEYNSTIGGLFTKGEQTPDGGYIISDMVGTTSYDLHLIKTDANGNVGCNISTVLPVQKIYAPPVTAITPTVYTGGSRSNFTPANSAITYTTTIDCIACTKPSANLSSNPTSICQGQTATLTASGGGTYSWSTGGTTPTIVVSPTVTTAYSATVTAGGCDSVPSPITVTVLSSPSAGISGNTTICTGQSTTLTASGGGTYLWSTGATSAPITVTPATTTSYTVTVTGANGCTATAATTVNVLPPPSASISAPSSVCSGSSVTLTASGGTSYLWNTGATTPSINVTAIATTTYSVTVSNGSCSSATSATVTVNPLPASNISGNTNICQGETTTLTASGGGTYLWNTGATTVNLAVAPASSTTYTVTVTGANGCSNTASVTVNVSPPPVASVSGNNTICSGASTTLTASGGLTYSWIPSAVTTSSITVSPTTSTTYSVIVSAGNCADTASVLVTVNPSPVAVITGNNSLCSGASVTLSASGGGTYSWNTGATNSSIAVSPTVTTSYSVIVSNGLCTDTASVNVTVNPPVVANISGSGTICSGISATLTASGGTFYSWNTGATTSSITVSPSSSASYTVVVSNGSCSGTATAPVTVLQSPTAAIAGNTAVCSGTTATLTASGGVNYVWNTGATSSSISVSPATNTSYTVTVTSSNGCTASAITTVTVTPVPVATISQNSTICAGSVITLTAGGGTNYSWNTGATASSITATATATAAYTVVVANGSCTDTASTNVYVNPNPTANAGTNVTINYGSGTTLAVSGSGGVPPYSYLWSTGETTSVISVFPIATTTYCATVIDSNGCRNTSCVTVYIDFQCGELFIPNAFSPNGDGKNDFFKPRNICFKTLNLVIYDRWGNKVFETEDIGTKGWDGKWNGNPENTAVFFYVLNYELVTGEKGKKDGSVTLIE